MITERHIFLLSADDPLGTDRLTKDLWDGYIKEYEPCGDLRLGLSGSSRGSLGMVNIWLDCGCLLVSERDVQREREMAMVTDPEDVHAGD